MMKITNTKYTKAFCKTALCAAMLAALPIQAATLSDNADLKASQQLSEKKIVIKLGDSWSNLSDELTKGYAVKQPASQIATKSLSKRAIAAQVAGASLIHVNVHDFVGNEKTLNTYLDEAVKQSKLMVFENSLDNKDFKIDALPAIPYGEVVLIQPRNHIKGDSITVFGAGSNTSIPTRGGKEDYVTQFDFSEQRVATASQRLVQMKGEALTQALIAITSKINSIISQTAPDKGAVTTKASGGGLGYDCPALAKAEKLCYAATVTNTPYYHISGNADLNVLHHYSYGVYRTDQDTVVAVSATGSANPNMKLDNDYDKAYYLQSVDVSIDPSSTDGLSIVKRLPVNKEDTDRLLSTSGFTFGISGDVSSSGPSLGGSFGYNSSESLYVDISDWETTTTSNGTNAQWLFELFKYQTDSDWVNANSTGASSFKDVPNVSKYGLVNFIGEAVWQGDADAAGDFAFDVTTVVTNREQHFTHNPWHWQWSTGRSGWIHTLNTGGVSLNLHWLKYLGN
jgi:hypothetical protein